MLFGLEKEYFIYKNGVPTAVDTRIFPYDACGYLVEARTAPVDNILDAVFLLRAQEYKLNRLAATTTDYTLSDKPLEILPKSLKIKLSRTFEKGLISYQNLYGFDSHANGKFATAGVHISFSKQRTIYNDKEKTVVNIPFDFIQLFRTLDKAFEKEIKLAKRRPGFYEMKSDGRVEYRSLPSNVSLDKVILVIENYRGDF